MSKGGETSSSASAQTPAQWASTQSNTAIAAWREADIVGFSQAQLKALTAAQISHITVPWAVPAAVWTADTLNAVPLQYWSKFGTRYRVTTNNGVSRITELSQRSGDSASGQCNWFDDLGYSPASDGFSFSAAVIAGISNERIAQIGAGHTPSAPQLTPNADGVISSNDFNAALTAATASGGSVVTWTISDSETAYMFASGWANMGAHFMGALTVSQLGAIAHPETALGAAQFAYLSANQLIALSQMDWSRVSAAQLNATTINAFSGLQTNILRAISETTWGGLDKVHTMALNAADIQLLSASAIASMQYLGYALTANVGEVLAVAQVQSIAANCWAQISDSGFLNALSTAALQAIPVSAFANMADVVLANLDSTHVAALTANQAANYPLNKLSDASSAFYRDPASLNFADFIASGNVNWRQAPASFIKRLTAEQLRLISPSLFATLSLSALAGLTRSQTQSLTLEQIQSLSASQLSAVTYISRRTDVAQQIFTASILTQMSLDFWRRVDSDFLNALSITAFQAITSGQMTVIAADAFNRLDQVHINSLTRTQMLALTAAQVGQVNGAYLTLSFLRGVRLEAFKGLVPEQMRRLHDYLFNTVVSNAFSGGNTVELEAAEMQFATLVASIMDGDDGREAWLKQSVDLLIRLQWLDPAAAASLSASDVQNTYATLNWSWMSGSFLNNITTTVFSQLKASNIAQLNVGAVAILNDAHVQVLTATQVAAMSGEQLSAIANLGALQASAVQSLSDAQIAGMTQNWGQINPTFLSHMTARQFIALTPSQFGQLNVAQLATTAIDWRLIAPEQLNALPLTEFSKLCTGSNPAILGTTTGVLLGLGGEQMVILAQAAASYSLAQKNTLLNRLFGAFSTEQTERLIDLMKNDSAENIVLQTGLVALLAKMDGTTIGINTAIQTLVSLRQMQPSWFSADNLSHVLSVLSARYTNYLQQYQHVITEQNFYNYVFLSQSLSNLFAAKMGTNPKVSLATSTSLALGNLLVMIGAGINSLGQAIETASNHKLTAKKRDALIAAASLNAVASVAQGLQLGVNVVLQALIRRYTGAPAQAIDEVVAEAFGRRLSVEAGQGLQAAIDAPVPLPEQALPPPAVTAIVEVINPVNPPPAPVDAPPPPVDAPPVPVAQPAPERPQTPALGHVVLDMGQPAGDQSIVVAHPPNPVDGVEVLPETQFGRPLSELQLTLQGRVSLDFVTYKYLGVGAITNAASPKPQLLTVTESGIAVVVVHLSAIDFTSQFVPLSSKEVFATMAERMQHTISKESLQEIVMAYHEQTGKQIKEILIHNVSGELPLDKNIRIADGISMADAGRQDIAAGRFILENLDRFVYRIWSDAELKVTNISTRSESRVTLLPPRPNEFRLGNEVLILRMKTVISKLFGFRLDEWGVYVSAGFSKTLKTMLNKIRAFNYLDFRLDDAVLADAIWSEEAPSMQELIRNLSKTLPKGAQALQIDEHMVRSSLDRLTQSYMIDAVKNEVLRLSNDPHWSLEDTRHYITTKLAQLTIAPDVAEQASHEMLVTFLLKRGESVTRTSGRLFNGLVEVYKQASTDPALLQNLAIKSYIRSQLERIDWGARPGVTDIDPVNNTWTSLVDRFKQEGISLYVNRGMELSDLGILAINMVLRTQVRQQIDTIVGKFLRNYDSSNMALLLRDTYLVERNPTVFIVRLKEQLETLQAQILESTRQITANFSHQDKATVLAESIDFEALDQSTKEDVRRANTTLVEYILTEWAKTIIQMEGDPLRIRNWNSYKHSIHRYINSWLVGIEAELGKAAFVPNAFAKVEMGRHVGDKGFAWTQLHESIVERLKDMHLDRRYLFKPTSTTHYRNRIAPVLVVKPNLSVNPIATVARAPVRIAVPESPPPPPQPPPNSMVVEDIHNPPNSPNSTVGEDIHNPQAPIQQLGIEVERIHNPQALIQQLGIENAHVRLNALKVAVMNFGMLGFALFASVVGIAAGIAGFIYAVQSTSLSWQARMLMFAMNWVRVFSSVVMLGASGVQIAANIVEGVGAATKLIANGGFLIGNVIGIATNFVQIGLQTEAMTSATDSTSRLIAGLAMFDATIQLILNIAGTIALAFGPIGVIVNLVTFIIAALLPNAAAIATAVKYRESYDDLTRKGLYKEAEVIYTHWQVAALDASPIVNWTSSIYTPEMKKMQERRMDYAWMDKSGEERLLYALNNNTDLKGNFDSLRAQIYAGAAALNQSFVNLGQGLTRAVTLMLSQESLSYFEGDKLATVKQAATFNYMTNTVSRAPKLVSAVVNGQLVTLTFNQNLASRNSQLPNLSAFTVKVDGVATTVSGFALLNNTITLTLASAVTEGQLVTFSYSDTTTGDDSHAVQNLLGKDAASIADHAVVNRLDADHRAPLLVDAVVEDKYLSLLFDEGLDSAVGKVPDKSAFTVTIAGNNAAIQSVAVSGQRVLLTLVDKVAVGAVVSFNYTAGEQGLRDTAGNKVAALSAQAVDNTSSSATVSASRVGWLQYDNFVASTQGKGSEAASVLNGADYTVYANEAGAKAGTARLRYLSLSNAVGEFDMYSASRATDNNDRIWLDASSAQGLSNFAINTKDMTVWGGQGKNSYSLSRQYANSSYIVAANSWSSDSNVVSLSGASGDSNHVVNLDYLLTADNISGGLAVTQTPFKVLGSADGLDEVIGSADNQTYYATSNVANVRLTGANANVFVGESAKVNVGWNGRVLVDMDMWRGLNLSQPTTTGVIKGSYGKYSLLNFAPTDTVNDSFIGKLDLRYQIGHLPTLGAFTVNAGGANVAVTQMKISGSKVTLSLASAVQQNQAVRVSYQDVSASNDADTLQDLAGNDVGNFSAQVVSNVTADTTAPTLKVATVQGSSLIVRFSEALLQAVKPLASDFTVKVAGTAVAVSKVAFNDSSSLLLTLASAVSAGQTVSMGYSVASDTTVAVQDLAGNASSGFTNASVVNLASVTVAPGLRSVTANGNVLTLKFDGTLRYTLSDASAFLVTADNTPMTISSVSVVGTSVLLYLASAVTSEQLVEVSYTAPQQASDTTTLRDWLGNGVGNLSAQVATNITAQDLTAPTLQYAIVNGNSLVLTFSEALNGQAGFTPVPSAFAVRVAGSTVSVTQAVVSGATVTLSLATAVDYAAAVSLSYTDLSASNDVAVVQDLAGNDAESFSHINVVNNTPNTTAPSLLSATVTENQLVLLFDDSLNNNVGYLPPLTSMSVNAAGVAVGIVSGSLNGDTATLTLSRAVNPDDYVTFNYSAPASSSSTQAFQDWSGNPLLSIANFSVSNLTGLDLTPPSFVSAEVNGNTLSLTFSEALASTASFTPGLNAFSVYVDGSLNTVSAVTLNGTQAVLSLNRAVSKEQVVTVSYSQPANRPIQDGAGNFATSFSGKAVSNVTVDTSAPTLSSASVAGALLTLTFNENLATDTTLIPSAKQFAVNVDGAVVDVLSAVVAGKVVTVTLNKAVTAAQAVSVDYTPATTGTNQLQDASGNATVRFSKTVSNWSGLASLQNATVSGTQLTLTFNQELDAISGHLPPVSAFAVQVAGVNSTVSQLVANGYKLTLTLDAAVNYGQTVTVNYTDPSTANDVAALQNLAGMDVQTFSEAYAVHNLTPQVTDLLAPSLNSAVANGSTVTLTFSEALDAGVGEWLVNYLPNGQYDAQGNPVVTSRLQASGFVNVLGSNSNDSFIIGDQSGLAASRQLNYIQLGNGQGVQVSHYDTSGNLLLAMGNTGQADVVLESGSSLQKLLTTKLVQSDADIVKYKAHRDTVTLKSLSSLTAFLAGYEVIDATESSSSLTAQIGGGDHQIKLGGQTVNLQFDKVASNTSITTKLIPNSWLDYQYFNFNSINADGLWVGRESDGTVLFHAQWTGSDSATTEHLSVNYDGTLSNVVMEVGHVLASAASSQLRLDKLIEVMSSSAFSTDPTAASKAIAVSDTSNDGAQTKLYRISDIVAYSAQPQSAVTGGV